MIGWLQVGKGRQQPRTQPARCTPAEAISVPPQACGTEVDSTVTSTWHLAVGITTDLPVRA